MRNPVKQVLRATLLLGLFPLVASAQQGTTLTGRVTAEGGAPLAGVSVSVPTIRSGALTDADGNYSFTIPALRITSGMTLAVTARRIGFAAKTTNVAADRPSITVNFVLSATAMQLDEIVTTALGVEKEKKALGVAQQTIDSTLLTSGPPTTNLVSDLSGKIAGVNITSASSQGGSARIVIRGATSIGGNNQPLFIVDGIPIDNTTYTTTTQASGGGGFDYGNAAQDINPDDIASMSVLKGPNAAALYGARAANGAIIITTKSGRGSRNFTVNGSTNMTLDSPLKLPEYQNSWGQGYQGDICDTWNKGLAHFSAGAVPASFNYSTCGFSYVDGNYGGTNDGVDESWGPRLDGTLRSQYSTTAAGAAEVRPWIAHPNNVSGFFQTGHTITSNVAAQGANDRANFRLSVTRQDVNGLLPNNTLNRTTSALNAGADITSKLSTTGTIQYIQNAGNNRPGTGYDEGNVMMDYVWFGRQVNIAGFKNNLVDANGQQISWNYSYHNSPWWTQTMNSNHDERDRVMGVASADYKFTDWLDLALRGGTDFYRDFRNYDIAAGWIGGLFDGNYADGGFQEQTRFQQETNTDFLFTAKRSLLSNLGITTNFGGNRRVNHYRTNAFGTDQLVIPGVYNIANAAKQVIPTESSTQKEINSLYGQAEFAYTDYAFITVTGRNDWSSTLPSGNNSYFYPSVSASYVFTQAFPSLNFGGLLNYGKLRGGWSRVGNDADPYLLAVTYTAQSQFGDTPRFTTPNSLQNATLKPENTDSWEVGTEMQWFDNRVGLDFSYYTKKTSNQILTANVSGASGFTSALVNAGTLSNRGVEAQVSLTPIRASHTGAFEWDVTANYGWNKNRVDALYGDLQTVQLGSLWSLSVEARKGQPYGSMFGVGFQRDSASHELLLSDGLPQPESSSNKRVLGNYTPSWTGGLDNTFHYHGFDFGFLFDTRQGGNIYSVGNMWGTYSGVLKATEVRPDSGLLIKGIDAATGKENTTHVRAEDYYHSLYPIQEAWIYDASFVKLREARFGFNLPQRWLRNTSVKQAHISLVGRNLFLWSNIPNIDPETAFSATNVQGFEMGQMPSVRSFGFQLSVTP
ncbi:MAG TPA: SusC/RagA family TonB-linked outer membrane protein [Gemmatimonadaceae bacterium]|jgi:TonB-linked SusC/RagA family outer membrane protein